MLWFLKMKLGLKIDKVRGNLGGDHPDSSVIVWRPGVE